MIEDDFYQTDSVHLINSSHDNRSNHFTLIVGNNGTGKSRLLGSIAKTLNKQYKSFQSDLFYFSNYQTSGDLKKLLAVSNSLSDKFPVDRVYIRNEISYADEFYVYLGTRGRMGSSSRNLIRRAIDIFLEGYTNKHVSKCYRHVFDYLEYKPHLTIEYKINNGEIFQKDQITPADISVYVERKKGYTGLNSSIFKNLDEKYSYLYPEICDYINETRLKDGKTFSLNIDFSYSNINKLNIDSSSYEKDLKIYEYLNILRRLNIIRDFDVTLYKKNGSSFQFTDASSGESNILTTLIALIPLVKNNSCILIDEPEISLHPNWQYQYIALLNKIFENFSGCHIIIASHSHFLVSDLPIENSSIVTLRNENGLIVSKLFDDSTYGWSAEDILLNIFNLPTSRNYYVAQIVTEALELLGNKEKKSKRFTAIKSEIKHLEPYLKEGDPLKFIINTILKA